MKSRDAMPKVAEFIDMLREAFGADCINDILRRGVRGEPVFHATENGHEIGTPLVRGNTEVKFDQYGRSYAVQQDGVKDAGSN